MGLTNWLKPLVLIARYSYGVPLQKNGSLGELMHQVFMALLVVVWFRYRFVIERGVAHGKDYGVEFCGRTCSKV